MQQTGGLHVRWMTMLLFSNLQKPRNLLLEHDAASWRDNGPLFRGCVLVICASRSRDKMMPCKLQPMGGNRENGRLDACRVIFC